MANPSNGSVLLIGGLLILALIIYGVVIYYCARNQIWIFKPYTPPPLEHGYQPGGPLTQLTAEQIAQRRTVIGS